MSSFMILPKGSRLVAGGVVGGALRSLLLFEVGGSAGGPAAAS